MGQFHNKKNKNFKIRYRMTVFTKCKKLTDVINMYRVQ